MAGTRHDSPRPREGAGWHIGIAQLACHPVGLERWKLLCASDLQKAVWLSLCLWYVVEKRSHLFSVHGFHLTNAIQLFPTQTLKNRDMLDAVTFALHAVVLESAVLQVTCLRFGTIVTFQSLYHIAWVWACQSFQLFSFAVKVLDSLKMERAVWNHVSENWGDLAHVFRG